VNNTTQVMKHLSMFVLLLTNSVSLRCNSCYNHTTNQRNYDLLDIPLNIQPQKSTMEGDKLIIACKS